MDFLSEYGMFLAKVITLVIFLLVTVAGLIFILLRARTSHQEHLEVKHLNHKYDSMALILNSVMLPKKLLREKVKELKARRKQQEKLTTNKEHSPKKKVFVLKFKGDIQASAISSLREEITAILMVATPQDEVVLLLESAGGLVHNYGLAASQLLRIKEKKVKLTVAIDTIAASGGYMMACVADQIVAAPFAVVGSIGVIGQMPNFNRLLKKHNIDFEQITAGEYKRTLTLFGEITDKGRQKFREDIEETHALFKNFVKDNRNIIDIEKVATGEHWYGVRALELKLVDELRTSDDYLSEAAASADLYEVSYIRKKPMVERLFVSALKGFQPSHGRF